MRVPPIFSEERVSCIRTKARAHKMYSQSTERRNLRGLNQLTSPRKATGN